MRTNATHQGLTGALGPGRQKKKKKEKGISIDHQGGHRPPRERSTLPVRPHDVPPGVAREDAARAHRRHAARVGGHKDAAADALNVPRVPTPESMVADNAAGQARVAVVAHRHPGIFVTPNLAVLQPPFPSTTTGHPVAAPVVDPAGKVAARFDGS